MTACFKMIMISLLFLCITSISFSQDVSGIWEGNYGLSLIISHPRKVVVEINISGDSVITGLSHLYYKNGFYEHYTIKGIFRKRDSTFYFAEDSMIAVKLSRIHMAGMSIYQTKLRIFDTVMRQTGKLKDKKRKGYSLASVWLEKKIDPTSTVIKGISAHADDPAGVTPGMISKRQTEIQHLVEIPLDEMDSIKIEVYDNGIVDNDSISLFLDNEELISKKRISTVPLVFYISLNKNNSLAKLRLIAESMGSIPPCTAVMVITTKHKRHEISLSSDFNKNAAVEFFLKD